MSSSVELKPVCSYCKEKREAQIFMATVDKRVWFCSCSNSFCKAKLSKSVRQLSEKGRDLRVA